MAVAARVALTLTTEVMPAAVTISALGTGICISVPGKVIVVASANCGESDPTGVLSGIWYLGVRTFGVGAFMGGASFSGGFLFSPSACSAFVFTRTPSLTGVNSETGGIYKGLYEGTSALGSSKTGAGRFRGPGRLGGDKRGRSGILNGSTAHQRTFSGQGVIKGAVLATIESVAAS